MESVPDQKRGTGSERQFKLADLISLLYRYVPASVDVQVHDTYLEYFEVAFTHTSAEQTYSYERTEFLGDSICNAILAAYIYRRFPGENEAFLTRLRSYLISGKVYAEVSRQIGLPGWLRLGERHEHLRSRAAVQEDVFESFVGAMFLALGYPMTELWVVRSFEEYMDVSDIVRRVMNPRERFTNYCISAWGTRPRIEAEKTSASGSGDTFVAKVFHPGTNELVAEGHAKTSTKAIGDACGAAMELVMTS